MRGTWMFAIACAIAVPLARGGAQETTAKLAGRVTDTSGVALAGAEVSRGNGTPKALSDSAGYFGLTGIPPGEQLITVRKVGYHSATIRMTLAAGESREMNVTLHQLPAPLDTVRTEAEATSENLQLNGFYARQRAGFGTFLTRDDIDRMHAIDLVDVVRRMPFVRASAIAPGRGTVVLTNGCRPRIFVDGARTPDLFGIPVQVVDGIELYRHATDIPVQYAAGGPCGAMLIWTR